MTRGGEVGTEGERKAHIDTGGRLQLIPTERIKIPSLMLIPTLFEFFVIFQWQFRQEKACILASLVYHQKLLKDIKRFLLYPKISHNPSDLIFIPDSCIFLVCLKPWHIWQV